MIPVIRLFQGLTQAQTSFLQSFFLECPEALGSCLMLKAYPKNHTLINTNDACAHVYILLSGRLQAIEERVACEPYRFTEIPAILKDIPHLRSGNKRFAQRGVVIKKLLFY